MLPSDRSAKGTSDVFFKNLLSSWIVCVFIFVTVNFLAQMLLFFLQLRCSCGLITAVSAKIFKNSCVNHISIISGASNELFQPLQPNSFCFPVSIVLTSVFVIPRHIGTELVGVAVFASISFNITCLLKSDVYFG